MGVSIFYNATYVSKAFGMRLFMYCCFSCWSWFSVLKQVRQRDTVLKENRKKLSHLNQTNT